MAKLGRVRHTAARPDKSEFQTPEGFDKNHLNQPGTILEFIYLHFILSDWTISSEKNADIYLSLNPGDLLSYS